MRSLRILTLAGLAATATVPNERLRSRQDNTEEESDRPTDPFRRRAMQQIVVMGDYAYFNGGEMSNYYNGSKEDDNATASLTMNTTMSIPLTQSWTNESIEFTQTEHSDPGSVNSFALWADPDANRLYRWGGSMARNADMSEDDVRLWAFAAGDDGTGTWGTQAPFDQETFDELVGAMGGASTSCNGKGYYIGGLGRSSTDPSFESVSQDGIPVPGILSYNFERRQWRNDSTVTMNPAYGEIINANAHCATGFDNNDGSLVFLVGGARTAPDDASQTVPNSMTNISFFNPDNHRWYAQSTTGDPPDAREHFCIAGARGSESYEIFVYGGENPKTGTSGQIHILSIPSFRWFRTEVKSPGRMHHACTVAGNRQMISTGGVSSEWDWEEQDPWRHSLGVFDMTALEWSDRYDADANDYETPEMIRDWFNENPSWESEMEWDDDDVRSLLMNDISNDSGGSSGQFDYDDSSSSSSTPTGAIAGGVVGGVAGIALIGGLVFFFLRRRKRARGEAIELESPTSAGDKDDKAYKPTDPGSSSPSTQFGGVAHDKSVSPGTSPVEMPTTEHLGSGQVLEMPTAGHERVEMEDSSRRELVG